LFEWQSGKHKFVVIMTLNLQNANAFEVVVITLQIRATYQR
jgi:hypothetical protein